MDAPLFGAAFSPDQRQYRSKKFETAARQRRPKTDIEPDSVPPIDFEVLFCRQGRDLPRAASTISSLTGGTISGFRRAVGNAGRGVRGRQPVPGEPGDTIRFYIRTPGGGAWRRSRRRTVPGMARSLGALFAGKSTEFLRKVEVTRKQVERNGSQEKAERNRAGQVRSRKFNHAETRCSWRFRYGMRVRGSDIQSISYWAVKLQEVSRQKPVRPFRSRGFGGVIRQTDNAVGRSCLVAPLLFLDRSQTLRRSRD